MSEETTIAACRPRHRVAWTAVMVCAISAIAFGVWCFTRQAGHGFIATSLRTPGYGGAAWGLYIAFDIFFVGMSFAGITVSALWRLFGIEALRPATRVAELITVTALISAAIVILADLGRPLHGLLHLPRYARPQSPFYGTFTLVVCGYMFSRLVYLFLSTRSDAAVMADSGPRLLRPLYRLWASGWRGTASERRRHYLATFWLSITIVPLLIIAESTVGFIFGIQPGRPGWFSALQAPAFVVLAGVSGTGMVILFLAATRTMFGLHEQIPTATLRWLTNFMATLALIYLYFIALEEVTANYAAPPAERQVAHEVVFGRYAPLFWTTVGCLLVTFAVPFILRLRDIVSVPVMVIVAALANVAAVCKRLLIVVPSQTDGALLPMEQHDYVPNWVEIGIVVGLFGVIVAAIFGFGRLFPLVPLTEDSRADASPSPARTHRWPRIVATSACVMAALGLLGWGLADSFRLFRDETDPVLPGSPLLFAGGVILLFASAAVYELWPSRSSGR